MIGLGTIVNVCAIAAGGLLGCCVGRFFSDQMQKTLLSACGIMVIFIGIGGTMQQMLKVEGGSLAAGGTMMMMISLLVGTIIGSLLNLEARIEQFGEWLKRKTGHDSDNAFVGAFVSASLTVCVGAMAIIGSIDDGIYANHTVLFTKAIIDFAIIITMASVLGIGTAFAAIPVGILQGLVTALEHWAAPLMTDAAMSNLSYVGDILITCVGINLLFPGKIKVANMLPALVIAIAWAYIT